MLSPRILSIVARVPSHPLAATMKTHIIDALSAGEQFAARKAELAKSGTLTAIGQREALRDDLEKRFGRSVARTSNEIAKARGDIRSRRANLKIKAVDPTNVAAALERQEIRSWFRSLDLMGRQTVALTTNDKRILDAVCTAPPELSGFAELPPHIAEQVEARYLELHSGTEITEIEAMESVVSEAEAAVTIARNDLQNVAEIPEREFNALMTPLERGVGRPWLKTVHGRTVVVKPGESAYPDATAADLAEGVFYATVDEWQAAQGIAA